VAAACSVLFHGDYEIVHLHSVVAGLVGILPRLRGCKTVLQMHGIEWQRIRWGTNGSHVLKLFEKISLSQSHVMTAVSKVQCNYYKNTYSCDLHYIPPAADIKPRVLAREIQQMGLEPFRYVLFASRLVPEKGAHYIITAFKKLQTDMNLVIAGDAQGVDDYKKQLIHLSDGDPRILFPGFVEGRIRDELFSNAYLFVQPSRMEGLSIALLEAMSYGNCCLVSDIPENIEAIGTTGYSFESGNTNSLFEKLDWLMAHPAHVRNAGAFALHRIRQEYSWDCVTDTYESLYHSMIP
jgi:glycosyltransferase involved in cell wall biosynthesis